MRLHITFEKRNYATERERGNGLMGGDRSSRCDNVRFDAAVQGGPDAGEVRQALEPIFRKLGFLEGHSEDLPP